MNALVLVLLLLAQSVSVESVQVRGNRRVPTDAIKLKIRTKPGSPVNPATVAGDIKAVYALGYFDDIRVEQEEGKEGPIVVFIVQEKPLIRSVEFVGAKSITQSEILEKLRDRKATLSVQSPYDPARIRSAAVVLRQMLAEKGRDRATVEVETVAVPPNSVNVIFRIDEGPKVKIGEIHIEGNHAFSGGQLKRQMKLIKESSPLTVFTGKDAYYDLKLDDDLNRIRMFYANNGYVRANILDPVVERKDTRVYRTLPFIKPPFPWGVPLPFAPKKAERLYITLRIEENGQYRIGDVAITGNTALSGDIIKAILGLRPGQLYNEDLLRKGFESLRKLYGARGYVNFSPVPQQEPDEDRKVMNLTINIDEGRQFKVDRVTFSGNTTTRDKVIRREIMIQEGEVFNSQFWDLSILRLNQLGYFDEIKADDAKITPDALTDKVSVNLKVKEKSRNSIGFSGGVSAVGGATFGLNYSTNNLIGLGENLSVSVQGGVQQSQYQLSFSEPYFLNRPIALGASVFATSYRYDQARDVYGLDPSRLPQGAGLDNRLNFEQKHKGFALTTSYPLHIFHRLGLNYQLDNSVTSAVNAATAEFFQSIASQSSETSLTGTSNGFSNNFARRLISTYGFNSTNNPYNPSNGRSFTGSLEFTGGFLGGNVNFYRPSFDFRAFKAVNRGRNTLAIRAIGSYIQGFTAASVPVNERFFMGGEYDIRGFEVRSLSPIAFITRSTSVYDYYTGKNATVNYDDIVYVGGDTQGVFNFEYRIPVIGPVTFVPFVDAGNAWVLKTRALQRQIVDSSGHVRLEKVHFVPGTNSGVRISAGAEVEVVLPVINAPFRLILALNPSRVDRSYAGPVSGIPIRIQEPGCQFKFSVGKTF